MLVVVVLAPVDSSPVVAINMNNEPVLQDPIEPIARDRDEGKQQQPQVKQLAIVEAPRRSQRVRKSAISSDYEVHNGEKNQIEGDPTSFEEAMRSAHLSEWLEATKDKMRSMSTNDVCNFEEIPKGTKIYSIMQIGLQSKI